MTPTKQTARQSTRKGVSSQVSYMCLETNYNVKGGVKTRLKMKWKKPVTDGTIVRMSGTGANGSFKSVRFLPKVEVPKKVKKPAAKKPAAKNAAPKKTVALKARTTLLAPEPVCTRSSATGGVKKLHRGVH